MFKDRNEHAYTTSKTTENVRLSEYLSTYLPVTDPFTPEKDFTSSHPVYLSSRKKDVKKFMDKRG